MPDPLRSPLTTKLSDYGRHGPNRTNLINADVVFPRPILMAQQKYLRLSHFVPSGQPEVHPGMSSEVREMMPYLVETVSRGWTKIPKHDDLEVFADRKMNVPLLAFRKNRKEVYLHVFCNEFMNPIYAIQIVSNLYTKFNFGKPAFALKEPNWIHTIPIPGPGLSEAETLMIHQVTQSLFWTIHADYKRSKGT